MKDISIFLKEGGTRAYSESKPEKLTVKQERTLGISECFLIATYGKCNRLSFFPLNLN